MSGLKSVVLTAESLPGEDLFTGYAFTGSNLVIGPSGYADLVARGGHVTHHDDGCYLLGVRRGDELVVGSDFKGNCKVFYYQSGSRWAVSNSIGDLVAAARGRGWPITVQQHMLETWELSLPFWDMCVSYETMVAEIRLLPRWSLLVLGQRGLQVQEGLQLGSSESRSSYTHWLREYVQTWTSRIGTVLSDERAQITVDVSGGLDSRVVLSLFLGARQYLDVPFTQRVRFNSNQTERRASDLAVAHDIANVYHLPLNGPRASDSGPVRHYSGGEQYSRWRSFAMGSYRPVYEPARRVQLHAIPFGGQGGEGHRRSYTAFEDPAALFAVERAKFERPESLDRVRGAIEESLRMIAAQSPRTAPLLAHFQEFRDRHHAGLIPQFMPRIVPLTGRELHSASRHLPSDQLLRGQALRDVHALTAPGLMMLPYDTAEKAPTAEILADLVRPLEIRPELGRVYGWDGLDDDTTASRGDAFVDLLLEDYRRADGRLPEGVLHKRTLDRARWAARNLPQDRGAPRAAMLRLVHTVIWADYLVFGD